MNKKFLFYLTFIGICILSIGISIGFIAGYSSKKNKTIITNNSGIIYDHGTTYPVAESDFVTPIGDSDGFTVTYVCNNGYTYTSTTKDSKVIKPNEPLKLYSEFKGWYSDPLFENVFDFETVVTDNISIYANWNIDFPNLLTYMYQNTILSNIKVLCYGYSYQTNIFGNKVNKEIKTKSLGSGEIIAENSNYYFALTNNHVVYQANSSYEYVIQVVDTDDREYSCNVLYQDKDYDLALLAIYKEYNNQDPLKCLDFANESPTLYGEDVITMGYPNGLTNALSLGKTIEYKEFTPDKTYEDESNVTFDVLCHSSYITSGSSGGALLDTNLKLIGINFASATDKVNNYVITYSIPIEKVKEFLDIYNNKAA